MSYPFEESKIPIKTRIDPEDCSSFLENGQAFIFPDVISENVVVTAGCSKTKWMDLYECVSIFCVENGIGTILFVWDDEFFEYIPLQWRTEMPPVSENFMDHLTTTYGIGWSLGFSETPSKTLEKYGCVDCPIQMYVSPPTSIKDSSTSTTIPAISASNPSCVGIILYRQLRCYCHASLGMNLGNPNWSWYVGNILSYCSAHGFLGVVFHCGKTTKCSKAEAISNMKRNIIEGITSRRCLTAKFLLETPAGQKNELFSDCSEFLAFVEELLSIPSVKDNFAICIDTCHVFAASYDPYNYIKAFIKRGIPIGLVHFNDSKNPWGSGVDRHAQPGTGHIPYPLLEKAAFICKANKIDMVYEC